MTYKTLFTSSFQSHFKPTKYRYIHTERTGDQQHLTLTKPTTFKTQPLANTPLIFIYSLIKELISSLA